MSCNALSPSDLLTMQPLATKVLIGQSLEGWHADFAAAPTNDTSGDQLIQVKFSIRRERVLQAMAVIMFIGAVRGLTHTFIPDFCLSRVAFDL
jgi:hypothetical protein